MSEALVLQVSGNLTGLTPGVETFWKGLDPDGAETMPVTHHSSCAERMRLVIGAEQGEHFIIILNCADCSVNCECSWIPAHVSFRAGAFHGALQVMLQPDDFRIFSQELWKLDNKNSGSARFCCLEEWFDLNLRIDSLGHVGVQGQVRDENGNMVKFKFEIDQSYLKSMLRMLDKISTNYKI